MKALLLILILFLLTIPTFAQDAITEASPRYNKKIISSEEQILEYVYSLGNIYNWHKNNPPFCNIIKGGYAVEGDNIPIGDFLGFGVISGETWDELDLKEDRVYKEGNNFIVERNVCIFPNCKLSPDWNWDKEFGEFDWERDTKDAKIMRIKETISPTGEYYSETIEVITDSPPLVEIFHWE